MKPMFVSFAYSIKGLEYTYLCATLSEASVRILYLQNHYFTLYLVLTKGGAPLSVV